jgi:hypothetical protein
VATRRSPGSHHHPGLHLHANPTTLQAPPATPIYLRPLPLNNLLPNPFLFLPPLWPPYARDPTPSSTTPMPSPISPPIQNSSLIPSPLHLHVGLFPLPSTSSASTHSPTLRAPNVHSPCLSSTFHHHSHMCMPNFTLPLLSLLQLTALSPYLIPNPNSVGFSVGSHPGRMEDQARRLGGNF